MDAQDLQSADMLGRELAWIHARQIGLVTDQMAKEAGLLEGFLYAPLSAVAAAISAPWGTKLRSAGLGLLLGAGIGTLADKENHNRENRDEKPLDAHPLVKAILAGISTGGTARLIEDIKQGKDPETTSALLSAAPVGALLHSADPTVGAVVGGSVGSILAAIKGRLSLPLPPPTPLEHKITGHINVAIDPKVRDALLK